MDDNDDDDGDGDIVDIRCKIDTRFHSLLRCVESCHP